MRILAADIGGTAIKVGEVTDSGELVSFSEHPSESKQGGPALMERLLRILDGYSGYDRIGISTAGQVDSVKGEILFANENIPNYTGMKIKEMLETRYHVPVAVENDVNAAAIGEGAFGAARGFKDYLCLTYGTGIGGGIVLDGKILHGLSGIAGEVGHIIIHKDGLPCACGASGCYERYASTTALVREAKKVCPRCENGRILFEELNAGNEAIREVIENWVSEIACGLASLIHTFNPPCVVLGGGIMNEPYLQERLNVLIRKYAMPSFLKGMVLTRAKLGNKAGIMGAAKLAMDQTV